MTGESSLTCVQCGTTFTFTEGEQQFYQERGYSLPKRCKSCREQAKMARGDSGGGGGGGGYGGGGGGGGMGGGARREFFDAVCAECGVATQVPFKPTGAKPVLCRDCFRR
jgi:CxxC-x17-CxxC domain-containing protein